LKEYRQKVVDKIKDIVVQENNGNNLFSQQHKEKNYAFLDNLLKGKQQDNKLKKLYISRSALKG
jgi:ribosomal protein L28